MGKRKVISQLHVAQAAPFQELQPLSCAIHTPNSHISVKLCANTTETVHLFSDTDDMLLFAVFLQFFLRFFLLWVHTPAAGGGAPIQSASTAEL